MTLSNVSIAKTISLNEILDMTKFVQNLTSYKKHSSLFHVRNFSISITVSWICCFALEHVDS
jgi:hypothetical protein